MSDKPSLFAKRSSTQDTDQRNKKGKSQAKNPIVVHHIKPGNGCDKKLELLVIHAENGNVAEIAVSWGFYKRNDPNPTVAKAAYDYLEAIGCNNFVHKITDGNGNVQTNLRGHDIKAFVKPLSDNALGQIDGPQVQYWFDNELLPAIQTIPVPPLKSYLYPSFDHKINYHVVENWSDIIGARSPKSPDDNFEDVRRIVNQEFRTPNERHVFGEWIGHNLAGDGNKFYTIFKQGFLTSKEIYDLQVPEFVLTGSDKLEFLAYASGVARNILQDTSGVLENEEIEEQYLENTTDAPGIDNDDLGTNTDNVHDILANKTENTNNEDDNEISQEQVNITVNDNGPNVVTPSKTVKKYRRTQKST